MKVKVLDKQLPMTLHDIIRFQVNLYCFLNDIRISPAQLDTLSFLGEWGEINLSDFCEEICNEEVFTNPQTVRNFMLKSIREGLVVRKGKGNKVIKLSDNIELLNNGDILINLKAYHVNQGKKADS